MKNIHIIGIGLCEAYIEIYYKNKLISQGYTKNSIYSACLDKEAYKIIIKFNNRTYSYIFIPYPDTYLKVNYMIINSFTLRDQYYGLPIKKGEIYLWKK